MNCSNQSSMATLLQQKNFMKNLTNGSNNVVVVNGTDDNQTATMVAAGATLATVPGAASRMLMPHETLVLPASHQQPLIHQQTTINNSFTTTLSPAPSNNSNNSFNSQFINHLQNTHHLSTQQLFCGNNSSSQRIATTATPTTTFQSSFSNTDVNAIYRPAVPSTGTTSIVSMQSFASSQQLPHLATSASSLVYVNGIQHGSAMVPKLEPSGQMHSQTTHHYLQQTVSESQTANTTSTADHMRNSASEIGRCSDQNCGTDAIVSRSDQSALTAATATDTTSVTTIDNGDEQPQEQEPESEIDIIINNVVCSFSVRCHLNLRDIALKGFNVEFRRENGMVTMKLRRPYTTASIWSSGKITCTGATSEDQAKVAARRYSRCLQKLGFNVRFRNFRIVNVLGTCSMPWGIMIVNFSEKYKKDASYEPELHPGVTYKLLNPKATLKIFSTGSITVTAASVAYVQAAIEHIFPLVYEFRKKRTQQEKLDMMKQPVFDPELLIEEECDIEPPSKYRRTGGESEDDDDDDDDADIMDDNDHTVVSDDHTKAIFTRKNRRRLCKSRYSSYRHNGRKRPAGKADNDPSEDAMYISDEGVDDTNESDED
ncbi:TATA-box-binding protein-like [Wyeomyia smithii]|uniref:TATA-box-binding protein-like n=1 Tax=Wyeomyia smithii TaxID=174621 RepID=UPI002467F74D|nr:TATA-box-binding protein-like [Wyeomyia smithii]XP_055524273.1 TATA-box-binding protein-like [Wyeomyia smithii]XP_055524274.1 TATA-box-binding protein-like [Wyeomyia smithii]XP_055524275.1 TATA-box-binding protein-like [Wyeomyia smithii]